MKHTRLVPAIGVSICALLAAGLFGTPAGAQTPNPGQTSPKETGPHPVRLEGKVSIVAGSGLVLTTRKGDVTVNITSNTWIIVQKDGKVAQGTTADIETGKAAIVAGMTTTDPKVVDARTVTQGRVAAARGNGAAGKERLAAIVNHTAAGTITAINGSTITLKGVKVPEVMVQTTSNTVVLNNGFAAASSLKVGDTVQVLGEPVKPASKNPGSTPGTTPQAPATRTIDAWALRVESANSKLIVGRVEALNGSTLTVRTPQNGAGLTVTVDTSTGYRALTVSDKKPSLGSASTSDLKVGSNVLVDGTLSADGKSLAAKAVILLPAPAQK